MGWISKLFGSDKALESSANIASNITSGVINGVDKMFYTSEEKAEAQLKFFEESNKVLLTLQDQFTPRSISRRVLAFLFSFCFCSAFVLSLVFAIMDKIDVVNNIINLVKAFDLGMITMTIVIFYFGNYVIDKFRA